jgi:hypothetical protein
MSEVVLSVRLWGRSICIPTSLYAAVSLAILSVAAQACDEQPTYGLVVTSGRPDDQIELRTEEEVVCLVVRSASGIGDTVLTRAGERWPERLQVRLHLKGLEQLHITNGSTELSAAVSSTGPLTVRTSLGSDESPIAEDSPWKLDVRVIDDDQAATRIPLADGYIEIDLPPALWESNPDAITIHWIDFYRG